MSDKTNTLHPCGKDRHFWLIYRFTKLELLDQAAKHAGGYFKARLHSERGMKHYLFLLLIFPRLKSKRMLTKAQTH